jgi:hypothetical protein
MPDFFQELQIDRVGWIRAALSSLSGISLLIYELLQNADDSINPQGTHASRIHIEVTPKYLSIWNDGVFSECGNVRSSLCTRGAHDSAALTNRGAEPQGAIEWLFRKSIS